MIQLTLIGEQAIDNVLKALPQTVTHSILGSANMLAAKLVVEKEKLLAPEGPTGNLVDSIGAVRTSLRKSTSLGQVIVGPRRKGGFKGFAGHLVEYGTRRRYTKSGANRGIMPAKPFALPAFEATKGQVEQSITESIGKVMIRTMKRYLK
jgi:HK97 gp10 family phage protein